MTTTFGRALAGALVLLAAAPAVAQDETQTFNAFAVVQANGTIVRSGEKQLFVAGTLAGPLFIETDEGPQQANVAQDVGLLSKFLTDNHIAFTSDDGPCNPEVATNTPPRPNTPPPVQTPAGNK